MFTSLSRFEWYSFYVGYIIRDDWKGDSKISDADRQGWWQTQRMSRRKPVFTRNNELDMKSKFQYPLTSHSLNGSYEKHG